MTDAARWNLQHNVPEDKSYEWTNYTVESFLDAYILARVQSKKEINERRRAEQQQQALKQYLADDMKKELDKTLRSALDEVSKDFNNGKITIKL